MVRTGSDGALAALLDAVAEQLAGVVEAAPFADALAGLDARDTVAHDPGRALGVLRWWDDALARPGPPPTRAAAAALNELHPRLRFTQNPNYVAAPPDPRFLGRYGYAVLAGPRSGPPALVRAETLAFGVLLLGPGTTYPTHVHPAAELYVPLGPAAWSVGDGPLVERAAGTPIVHAPDVAHATRTGAAPLAALYVWLGALATDARLLPAGLRRP
jgi:hypothetical protein